jgi:signal transduction histidine kinase
VGVKYHIVSYQLATFFLVNLISLLVLNIFVLYYFSKSLSGDISLVAKNLTEVAKGETVNLDMKLPVTSNDEMADLIIAFNKIQELEKANLKSIQEKQAMLVEGERLASLGQLIGGIAHNLRTPIMSISGGIEAVKELVQEYHDSIDDEAVTKEDLHEICDETLTWLEAMKPYCGYMSEIITTVREQAVPLNILSTNNFSLEELVRRLELLMKYELIWQ